MGIAMFLLGALAVLPGQEAQETKPELLQFAQLVRLPLEPVESPLGRSVFVVGKRTTNGSTFVAAVDGTTGERRWKFEIEGGPVAVDGVRGVKSKRGAMLVVRMASRELEAPQRWIAIDANDGKLLRELKLPPFETCVALELEPEGDGTCTSVDFSGCFRRRDARTGELLAAGEPPGIPDKSGRGVQIPDETGDGVPELVTLALTQDGPALHAFDGVSLARIRSKDLRPVLFDVFLDSDFQFTAELSVVSTPNGIRLRASTGGVNEGRHALLGVSLTDVASARESRSGEPMFLADESLALLRLSRSGLRGVRASFVAPFVASKPEQMWSEVVLPQLEFPWRTGAWLGWSAVHHADTTLWVTFPIGSRSGSEPVLAAYDVATGREVWKSENLLR